MTISALKPQLESGLASLNIEVSTVQVDQLLQYLALLEKWN
ncbi:MAG: 16S rRNA (guanine(527)-N(7))-methyltransferase RsmG, partial [Gammaproteobacteria bacterium]|nr:16S rRNA (guanine(527)-N(7))-methyltransferase RsmG [Gammaproteobacteria bacterium]